MRIRTIQISSACLVAMLVGCSGPTELCACPPARTHAVIYGEIENVEGEPISGASVSVTLYPSVCGEGAETQGPDSGPVQTDAGGGYRLTVYSLFAPRAVCARVTANGSSAGGAAEGDAAVQLRPDRVAPDSVEVDLQLR